MHGRVSIQCSAEFGDGLRSISEGLFNLTVAARAEHCQGRVCAEHDAALVDGCDAMVLKFDLLNCMLGLKYPFEVIPP